MAGKDKLMEKPPAISFSRYKSSVLKGLKTEFVLAAADCDLDQLRAGYADGLAVPEYIEWFGDKYGLDSINLSEYDI